MRRRRSSSAARGTVGTVKGRIAVESCAAVAAADVWTATTDVMAAVRNITHPKAKVVFMKPPVVRASPTLAISRRQEGEATQGKSPDRLSAAIGCDPMEYSVKSQLYDESEEFSARDVNARGPPRLFHERPDKRRDFVCFGIEREMSGIEHVHFGVRHVLSIAFRLAGIE